MAGREELLRAVPLFATLPKKTLECLDRILVERRFPAGADIVKEGESGVGFFLITEGTVEVLRGPSAMSMARFKKGDYFGEMALLDGHPRSATVRALEPARCLVLPRWDFLAELRTNADAAIELLEVMSMRVRELEERLVAEERAARSGQRGA